MELILLIFAAAACLWALLYAKHGSLMVGCMAMVVVGYVLGHSFWRGSLGPLTLTSDRLILFGLCGLLAWRWRKGDVPRRPLTGCDWLLALFLGYLTLRYAFTPKAVGIASDVSPSWRLIACFWMPAMLYWIARHAELTERAWKTMLVCLAALGGYLAVTAFAEVTQQWWAVFPRYISDPTLGTHFGRARGPALMSVSLGLFLTVCFWASFFLWSRVERFWQLILAGAMLLMCAAVYLTYTRSVWLGLAIGITVAAVCYFPRQWRPAIGVAMLVVAAVGVMGLGSQIISMGRQDSDGRADHSAYQRASFLYVSARMFRDNPMLGCGFGRFYDKKMPYLADRSQQVELDSIRDLDHHITPLSLLTETGLIGFVLALALMLAWGRAAWQLACDAEQPDWARAHGGFTLAVWITYVTNCLFHDLTLSHSEQWLLCLTAGVTVGLRSTMLCRVPSPHPYKALGLQPLGVAAPSSVTLFGISIDAVDMPSAVGRVHQWCRQPRGASCRYVVTPNVDHAVMYQSSQPLRRAYADASLVLADGAPVVLASRLLRKALPERVAGSDLVPAFLDSISQTHISQETTADKKTAPLRLFLLGGMPGVAELAAANIHRRWAGIEVVGTLSPPMGFEKDDAENEKILAAVASAQPDLLIIGLGAPKQELWVHRHADRLQSKAALCVGATIDFLAGNKRRSPRWMRRLGLEWFHRLASEPGRLARRYARDAWVFPQLVWRDWRGC